MAAVSTLLAAAAAGYSIYRSATAKQEAPPALPDAPAAPVASPGADAAAAARAAAAQRRKAGSATGRAATILTGPSGVASAAPVVRKTLLGE